MPSIPEPISIGTKFQFQVVNELPTTQIDSVTIIWNSGFLQLSNCKFTTNVFNSLNSCMRDPILLSPTTKSVTVRSLVNLIIPLGICNNDVAPLISKCPRDTNLHISAGKLSRRMQYNNIRVCKLHKVLTHLGCCLIVV